MAETTLLLRFPYIYLVTHQFSSSSPPPPVAHEAAKALAKKALEMDAAAQSVAQPGQQGHPRQVAVAVYLLKRGMSSSRCA